MPRADWDYGKDVSEGAQGTEADLPEETTTGKKNGIKDGRKSSEKKKTSTNAKKSKGDGHNRQRNSKMAGENVCFTPNDPDHTPCKQSKTEFENDDNMTRLQASQNSDIFQSQPHVNATTQNGYISIQTQSYGTYLDHSSIAHSGASYGKIKHCNVTESDHTVLNSSQQCRSIDSKFHGNLIPNSVARSEVWDYPLDQPSDSGYVSNSTNGYSDTDRTPMDLGSQLHLENMQEEASMSNSQGDGDIEDLLTQFQKFFKNRFESELENFRSSLGSLLEEQQSHIRQIMHTAIVEQQSSQSQNSGDDLFIDCAQRDLPNGKITKDKSKSTNPLESGSTRVSLSKQDFDIFTSLSNFQVQCAKEQSSREKKDKVYSLMSLACSVSTLLAKHQFRV